MLLAEPDFSNPQRYSQLQETFGQFLNMGVMPLVNENDPLTMNIKDVAVGNNDETEAIDCKSDASNPDRQWLGHWWHD